jgi:SAM-dependent methyltransferase
MSEAFRDFELRGWSDEHTANEYLDTFGLVTAQAIPALLEAAGAGPGVRLLDVATGPGYVASAAAAKGAIVTGVDFSPTMVEIARRLYPSLTFRVGDAQALDFEDGSFDAVIAAYGMLHFSDPDLATREACRVLRSGGVYAFSVWADPQSGSGMGVMLNAISAAGTMDVPLPPGPPQFRFSDPAECERVLKASGFGECGSRRVEQTWPAASADAWLDGVRGGSVRLQALLAGQTTDALLAIRDAVVEALEPYTAPDGSVAVPMPAMVAWGRKPA